MRQALTRINRNRALIALGVEPQAVDRIDAARPFNPHIRYGRSDLRGYVQFRLDAKALQAQLRVVDDPLDPSSAVRTAAAFAVEAGRPGAQAG